MALHKFTMDVPTIPKDAEKGDNELSSKNENSAELQSIPETPSFSDRVARLSISKDSETNKKIISELKHSNRFEDQCVDPTSGSTEIVEKRRRRRSSAQSSYGPNKELGDLKSSNNLNSLLQSTQKDQQIINSCQDESPSCGPEMLVSLKKRRKKEALKPISLEKLPGKPASLKELRDSMLACFGDDNYYFPVLKFTNLRSIKKVVVLFTPGLQPQDFGITNGSKFNENDHFDTSKSKLFERLDPRLKIEIFPVTAPGSKNSLYPAYNHFLNKLLSKRDRKIRKEELSQKKITVNNLLMSLDDLMEKNFPIHPRTINATEALLEPLNEGQDAYLNTKKLDHDGSHIFALDCEMCLSAHGHVLTRVSMVDFDMNIIYDELVKPETPITDYLTKYSGITEEKLSNVTKTFEEAQRDILNLVSEDDILIGHSFENDLNALKIRHPKIVDTSVIYEHKAGPPFRPALRNLTSTYLNYNIQTGEKVGHDSVEDAKACMDLVKLKIVNGLTFGISLSTENICERLSSLGARSLRLNENACRNQISNPNGMEASLRCVTDKEVLNGIVNHISEYDFFIGRLKGPALARGYVYGSSMRRVTSPLEIPSASDALDTLALGMKEIYSASSDGTMIVLMSGNGDTREYSEIMADLDALDRETRTKVRQEKAEELEAAINKARDGMAAVFFKQNLPHE